MSKHLPIFQEKARVVDQDFEPFLLKDFMAMDEYERYSFFKKLEIPINFAINKTLSKFHYLPVDKEDFTTIAWIAFTDVVQKFQKYHGKKTFISFIIDAVHWKCLDYASAFINNKHKVLNLNYSQLFWIENPINSDVYAELNFKLLVEDYFEHHHLDLLAQTVFIEYLHQTPIVQIAKKYNLSRTAILHIIKKTVDYFIRIS